MLKSHTLIVVYLNDANTIQDMEKCIRDINTSKCMTTVIRGNATDEHLPSVRRSLDECTKGKEEKTDKTMNTHLPRPARCYLTAYS